MQVLWGIGGTLANFMSAVIAGMLDN